MKCCELCSNTTAIILAACRTMHSGPNQGFLSNGYIIKYGTECWSVCRVAAECAHGCCRMCAGLQSYQIFSQISRKYFFGSKKFFKQKVATQAKSQRGLKIIHRLVQSLWSLIQSYLVVHGGTWATKSSAQDGFWPDIALWTLWPTVQCSIPFSMYCYFLPQSCALHCSVFRPSERCLDVGFIIILHSELWCKYSNVKLRIKR